MVNCHNAIKRMNSMMKVRDLSSKASNLQGSLLKFINMTNGCFHIQRMFLDLLVQAGANHFNANICVKMLNKYVAQTVTKLLLLLQHIDKSVLLGFLVVVF